MKRLSLALLTFLALAFSVVAEEQEFREDFNSRDSWEPLVFPDIERQSTYRVESGAAGESFLRTESNASASGLVWKERFNVYDTPVLRWRWKVENVFEKGDATRKSGDDYPARVYVLFEYDPEKASFWKSAKYETAKLLYGEYPPHSSLNYIWANRGHEAKMLVSPYTDSAMLIVTRAGKSALGQWLEEEVNMLEDYRRAFGEDPPATASLAIMNDSDNTSERAVSFIDFIEVRKAGGGRQ